MSARAHAIGLREGPHTELVERGCDCSEACKGGVHDYLRVGDRREFQVCKKFAGWFRSRWPGGTTFGRAWRSVDRPSWLKFMVSQVELPPWQRWGVSAYHLLEICFLPYSYAGDEVDVEAADQLRMVVPAELVLEQLPGRGEDG